MVGGGSSKACILRYSYSSKFLGTNIFDICIRSSWQKRIYSIFVFGKLSGYEYIRYLYLMKIYFPNIFIFSQDFDIRVTLSKLWFWLRNDMVCFKGWLHAIWNFCNHHTFILFTTLSVSFQVYHFCSMPCHRQFSYAWTHSLAK